MATYADDTQDKANVVHNQPYDETLEVSDGEEIASTNATPRGLEQTDQGDYHFSDQHEPVGGAPPGRGYMDGGAAEGRGYVEADGGRGYIEEDEESGDEEQSESEESEEQEEPPHATLAGAYDPAEFEHLQVSSEMKELFKHISRYTPQSVDLDTKMRPFIPEFIPAIGDIDAFLKVTRPDGKSETLGLAVIDEPKAKQSDPTVLDLQLRTLTKQTTVKPVAVHSIPDPEKQPKALENWIESISELHRQKPATNVHYAKNMPDIENLMQEWPSEFEEALKETGIPSADLDCDLGTYADILCALLDIPVYNNRIHSLHVLFSLYMEFKNSQHFKSLAVDQEEPGVPEQPRSDSVITEIYVFQSMTSNDLEGSPAFKGFLKASGQAEVWDDTDKKKFSQFGWRTQTTESAYSSDTLIGNWNEERFDVSKLAQSKRLPSQYDHYFETTYRQAYLKSPPKVPDALRYSQNKEPSAFPAHQPISPSWTLLSSNKTTMPS